ncbi:unnamed protein product [Effrenium voratum]|nr:unnamed protein product [Effrenium voratum]
MESASAGMLQHNATFTPRRRHGIVTAGRQSFQRLIICTAFGRAGRTEPLLDSGIFLPSNTRSASQGSLKSSWEMFAGASGAHSEPSSLTALSCKTQGDAATC